MAASLQTGGIVARILRAALHGGTLELAGDTVEVARAVTVLLDSGGGGLTWRVASRGTPLPRQDELRTAYRRQALQAALRERAIGRLFRVLQSRGVEALMGKGWAVARQYPDPGLRPCGDIDLYVRAEQAATCRSALCDLPVGDVDLHVGGAELDDQPFDALYARSQRIQADGVEVRIFRPEDHLRLVCLHMLREGALRPLWLFDVAVMLRALPSGFDWASFLQGDAIRAHWATCAIALAHHVLGVCVERAPACDLPPWMVDVVLHAWGSGRVTNGRRRPMSVYLRDPRGVLAALAMRWPNPIEATVNVRGRFNGAPRLPYQLASCVKRSALCAAKLLRGAR